VNDRDFLAAFEAGTLSEDRFHHPDHVRAAWLLLREEAPAAALDRFSSALKRFAAAKGKKTRLYHETITWAYVLLINERVQRSGRRLDWEEFASANPDLPTSRPSVLDRYYTSETLGSELARQMFLLPDR
jgi:hypothetical protein